MPKVVIVGLLLCIEGIIIPTYTVILQNRWPTTLEFVGFVLSAVIQLLTYLVVWIEGGTPPQPPSQPPPNQPQ